MKIKYIVLLFALVSVSLMAHAQLDTINLQFPYYYPNYNISGVVTYDSAARCKMDFRVQSVYSSQFHVGIGDQDSGVHPQNLFVGYVAESDMDILGISQPCMYYDYMAEPREVFITHSFMLRSFSHCPDFIVALGTPDGDAVYTQRQIIVNCNDVEWNRILKLYKNNGPYYERHYYYDYLTELLFEEPYHVSAGDTFYLAAGVVDSTNPDVDRITFYDFAWAPYEAHYDLQFTELHFPERLYRYKDTTGWQSGTFHVLPFFWAIVRFPGDTCPEPQGLRATWLADNVALLQFDTVSNHAVWEVCYGPAGTAPGGGTVVEATIPQAVLSGLDPDLHYTVYVRARCDFAYSEWTAWSAPFDICMAELGIAEVGTSALGLRLSPNPAKGSVKVECDVSLEEVSISDASGRTVLHQKAQGATELTLDIHQLSPGVYTLLSATKSGQVARKLAVQ